MYTEYWWGNDPIPQYARAAAAPDYSDTLRFLQEQLVARDEHIKFLEGEIKRLQPANPTSETR